ncbi:MAG: hypothetical protein ACOCP2_01770, partial [Halohasta sp.]
RYQFDAERPYTYTEITVDAASRAAVTGEDVLAAIREGSSGVQGRRAPIPMAAKHYCLGAGRKSGYYAKVGTVTTASYARFAALKGGSLAKLGAVKSLQGLSGLVSAIR